MSKKNFSLDVSKNNWAQVGTLRIQASSVKKIGPKTLLVNGAVIQFDEEIDEPVSIAKK